MIMMVEKDLSIAAMHRIIRKAGAERVSKSASKELAKVLEEIGLKISRDALEFALHAGRVTVQERDVKIAAKKFMNR